MRTEFDLCEEAGPLHDKLWFSRGTPQFWTILELCHPMVRLQPPATEEQLQALRDFAGGDIPEDLEAFLRHSNGFVVDWRSVVHSVEGIIGETRSMRDLDVTFPNEHLLFIGELGDGDLFAFGRSRRGEWTGVFWWEHETDSCYEAGLGIWGYVAKHVSWICAVREKSGEDPEVQDEKAYRDRLRKISGEEEAIVGLRKLVGEVLQLRATQDLDEVIATDLLREYLNHLSIKDFRKIPIERLIS